MEFCSPLPRGLLGSALVSVVLLAMPCSALASPKYGVTASAPIAHSAFERMHAAGVDVLRLKISWSGLSDGPVKGLDWDKYDKAVAGAARHKIEVIPCLNGAGWLKRGKRANLKLDKWKRFVSSAMKRYGTDGSMWRKRRIGITTPVASTKWEVGVDNKRGRLTARQGDRYTRLLSVASRKADEIDRGAEVSAVVKVGYRPGEGSAPFPLLEPGAIDSIDTVVVEPIATPGIDPGRGLRRVRQTLDRLGHTDVGMVVAPVGWGTDRRGSGKRSVGLKRQARLLRLSFERIDRNAARWDVEAIIWSAWQDGARSGCRRWCRSSGLLRRDGTAKPSFHAFKRFSAASIGGAVFESSPKVFFGVAPDEELTSADIRTMGESGVGATRLVISWQALQPSGSGPIDWRRLDQLMESLVAAGIEPVPQLIGPPADAHEMVTTDLQDWQHFVSAVVGRYGPQSDLWASFADEHPGIDVRAPRVWQVWNEPNNSRFWSPKPSPDEYAKLLHASATAIRAAEPGAEVMLAGMYGYASGMPANEFLKELYQVQGAITDFDIVAIHPYATGNAGIASQLEGVRDTMDLFGDYRTDIWATEFGWSSVPIDNPVYAGFSRDEPGQARALRSAYEMLLANRSRWRLRGAVWYSWRDARQSACIFCQYTGLLRNDGTPKPSLEEFAALGGRNRF